MSKTATVDAATETPADTSAADEAQAQADFDAGAAQETILITPVRDESGRFAPAKEAKSEVKPETKTQTKPADPPAEEFMQITKKQFERLDAAAKRTDDFEKQISKAFGTIGDVQKIVRTLQGQTPRGLEVAIPDGAFADMEKDFPELAKHTRAALEATLKGIKGTGNATAQVDVTEFDRKIEERVIKLQTEVLEDTYPDWLKIVGAVDVSKGEKPDDNNPFRKWLATKDAAYQAKINSTNSAGVITRAIEAFKSETKKPATAPKPEPKSNRIQEAIRPKGDGGQPPLKDAEDDFESGFITG